MTLQYKCKVVLLLLDLVPVGNEYVFYSSTSIPGAFQVAQWKRIHCQCRRHRDVGLILGWEESPEEEMATY